MLQKSGFSCQNLTANIADLTTHPTFCLYGTSYKTYDLDMNLVDSTRTKKDLDLSPGLNSGGEFHTYDLISMRPSTVQKVAGL